MTEDLPMGLTADLTHWGQSRESDPDSDPDFPLTRGNETMFSDSDPNYLDRRRWNVTPIDAAPKTDPVGPNSTP